MYILNNLAFIAHPKTASTATMKVLRAQGAQLYGNHHEVQEDRCSMILDSGGIVMSTVRNPFDVMVSWYFHYANRRKGAVMEPFREWLPWILNHPNPYMEQGMFYGLPWTNWVLRYENLQADFNAGLTELGLAPVVISPANVSHLRDGRPYQEMYDTKLRNLIEQHYEDELSEFGYALEE